MLRDLKMSSYKIPVMDVSGNNLYSQVIDVDFNSAVFNKVVSMERKIDEMYAFFKILAERKKKNA